MPRINGGIVTNGGLGEGKIAYYEIYVDFWKISGLDLQVALPYTL